MFWLIALLIFGFILLIGGAELLVRGASSLAKNLGVSSLVIGLTVVAFGTSAPEFIVNLLAMLKGSVDIGIGNIVGSNISNILLILGVGAVITPLAIKKGTVWKEIPFAFLAVLLMMVMANDRLFDGGLVDRISHIDGIVLISLLIIFMYYVFGIARTSHESHENVTSYKPLMSIGLTVAGILGLVLGGRILVDSAITLAKLAGVSEALIGLTIVAIGTSLPELATVVVASMKKQTDLAIGNVVGSNIFNVFWIVGIVAVIQPIAISQALQLDIALAVAATTLLFIVMFVGKRHTLQRYEGYIFILLYIAYIGFLISRG